jgi:hypothetical protein
MLKLLIDTIEDIVMFSACFAINIGTIITMTSIASYLYFVDLYFTAAIFFLGYIYLLICYKFYIKNINESRDVLLDKLEKSGRKALGLEDDVEAIKLFNKDSSCQLPTPTNAKQFTLSIVYIGKNQITVYQKCPKSHIFKIEKKKKPGKIKASEVAACAENNEYYFTNMLQANYAGGNIVIKLKSKEIIEIPTGKAPGQKVVNRVRQKIRERMK